MTAKEEFYALISLSLSKDQVSTIKVILDGIEMQINDGGGKDDAKKSNDIKALYYDCCSLFYSCAKDFNNFKGNLANITLPLDYTKYVLASQDEAEERKMRYYNDVFNKVLTFIQKQTKWQETVLNVKSLALAITNAIVPEILAQKDTDTVLNFYKNVCELQELSSQISDGKNITRISFDLDNKRSACVIKNKTCVDNLYNDLVKFSSYRMVLPDNIDEEIDRLNSQVKHSLNRIVYRICMVLVHYNILENTTDSDKFILKNSEGEHISLTEDILATINLLLGALGQRPKEWKYDKPSNKKLAERCQNLLRTGKKEFGDNFEYSKITDKYWGCFLKEHD